MADIKNSYIRPKKEDTIVYGRIVSASTEGVVADADKYTMNSSKLVSTN